jgi:Asp-tRNA(Asn)/Glu-tRNA(Gln) amidotransferase B subunit
VAAGAEPLANANLISNRLAGVDAAAVSAGELAQLVEARDRIPRSVLDEALERVAEPGFAAAPFLSQEAVSDSTELEPVIAAIIAANPAQVDAFRGGKEGLLGFFVGQVMKETGGKANARVVSELVRERLAPAEANPTEERA